MNLVVIFNGPPSSGKDHAVRFMMNRREDVIPMMFKEHLYRVTAAVYGVDEDWFIEVAMDRSTKEMPYHELMGKSPREALIHTSEVVIKPIFGNRYFGEVAGKRVRELSDMNLADNVFAFSDGGFVDEAAPLIEAVGHRNVMICPIERSGFTFEGDSRNYLKPEDFDNKVKFVTVKNDSTIDNFETRLDNVVSDFISTRG